MAERSLNTLNSVAKKYLVNFLAQAKAHGLDLLVTCTSRTWDEQDALYAQGRTLPGHIVTNSKGGESFHNWNCAIDVVILVNGKPLWEVYNHDGTMKTEWKQLGAIAEQCKIEWAGSWRTFKEYAHFQYTGGLSIADFKSGKELTDHG